MLKGEIRSRHRTLVVVGEGVVFGAIMNGGGAGGNGIIHKTSPNKTLSLSQYTQIIPLQKGFTCKTSVYY